MGTARSTRDAMSLVFGIHNDWHVMYPSRCKPVLSIVRQIYRGMSALN